MPSPTYPLATLYCSDEDLAVRAAGDFGELAPRDQLKAEGADGSIAAGTWVLASSAVDFGNREVAAGDMVRLWGAKGTPPAARFGPEKPGTWFAVDSVAGSSLTLRRKGMEPGSGEPAGGAAPLSGASFAVATLRPQVERASRDLNHRFGIDAGRPGRAAGDLYDLDDLRDACELTVLHRLYLALSRNERDDWKVKALLLKQELDEVLGRLAIRWGAEADDRPATVRVGRVER